MKGIIHLATAVGIWLAICVLSIGFGLIPLAIWILLVFLGSEGRASRAVAQMERTLMAGETLVAATPQHRVFALFKRRAVLAITSSRVLMVQRGLIGGFRMIDMQWKDLKDVRLEQNVLEQLCGANLNCDGDGRSRPVRGTGLGGKTPHPGAGGDARPGRRHHRRGFC
jgi:hypothetical protein